MSENKVALTLKYRPDTWEKVVGQPVLVKLCSNLSRQHQARNIIFQGQYGSGKTTSARIYAKALLCENVNKETGSPCGECESCKLFEKKQHPSYTEIDVTNVGGKEGIQQVLDLMNTVPIMGDFRILMLDECHSLSSQGFDALLKYIEEPKPYQVFLFSTTEVAKVRPAVRSRCDIVEVSTLNLIDSVNHLKHICQQENIPFEEKALEFIYYKSEGHPRDLLKYLEQIYNTEGQVTLEAVTSVFQTSYVEKLQDFMDSFLENKDYSCIDILTRIQKPSDEIRSLLMKFIYFLKYRIQFNDTTVLVDPGFNLIPTSKIETYKINLIKTLEELKIDMSKFFNTTLNFLATKYVGDSIQLTILCEQYIDYVFKLKCGEYSYEDLDTKDTKNNEYNNIMDVLESQEKKTKRKVLVSLKNKDTSDTSVVNKSENLTNLFTLVEGD